MRGFRHQRGFSIIVAVFLIVVLAALAIFLARITATSHQVSALAYREAQALLAARAGLEQATYLEVSGGVNGACDSGGSFTVAGYPGFSITVSCSVSQHTETGTTQDVYALGVQATAGSYNAPGYVTRRVAGTVVVK